MSDKAQTHHDILRRASEAFQRHGSGVGIGEIMKELGLTRGGFYRHFGSKDDLLVEAVALSLNEIADRLDRIAQKAEPGSELAGIITAYMSEEQLHHPESWCALATLSSDIGRQSTPVRKRLDAAMLQYMEKMLKYMPGATQQERSGTFLVLFSGMAGAMAMMRAMGDKEMRHQVLGLTRGYYLKTFAAGNVSS
ncbi:MAG: TetR/AcrR family transcriptional regulator [Candidatus Eremiobacteraeota bacterium]|nr:TetR/AcrR family transcriptional regulator [Candidatus Eremiobacteraeota bacterium]